MFLEEQFGAPIGKAYPLKRFLIYLNNFFNPSVEASQTPFSVISPVTYLAGVTSKAMFIALLFFG